MRLRRMRLVVAALAAVMLASGCSGAAETADPAVFEADVVLMRTLWAGFSASWAGGRAAGYAYVAAHDHPALGCTEADFEPYWRRLPDPFAWEVVLDESTVERHDRFTLRDEESRSFVPEGRLYRHRAVSTYTGDFPTETREWESHSAILDGEAVFFFPCR